MESSNPTLNNKVFTEAKVFGSGKTMTVQGTVNKAFVLLAVLLMTAGWSWSRVNDPEAVGFIRMAFFVSMAAGFVLAIATTFKPRWAPVSAPIYAACQGVFLGILSAFFEARYPGIVMQATGLTFSVMLAMLMGYKAGWLQATPGLRKGLMIAMGGIFLFYMVVMIAGFFNIAPPGFVNGATPLGIAFSLFVVGIASMSLILDFDFIEKASNEGLEKHMEWYAGFSLMVTLIWLYVEILRLLSKLNSRN